VSEDYPAQLSELRPGSLIAGYRLETRIGAGGMAVVFRARDERLGRLVALKLLGPALASDPGFRRRFIAESRAAAVVDDPHIIPVYEAGEADGVLFIAMRFVGGGDLRRVLDREGALPPARAAEFISPVASALDAAHRAGLVHRDVKPANILVDASADRPDHVYLSDFGVSKGATSSVGLTGTGQFLGTPDYSAPEQIQGRPVDGRTDQYALACVAYQLLTGVVPFQRDQGMAVLLAHVTQPPPSLAAQRPELAGPADQVLARGMAKTPEHRYGSCREFSEALRQALGLTPYHSQSSWPPQPQPPVFVPPVAGPSGSMGQVTVDSQPRGPVRDATDFPETVLPVPVVPATAVTNETGPPTEIASQPVTGQGRPPGRSRRPLAIGVAALVLVAAGVVSFVLTSSSGSHGSPGATGTTDSLSFSGVSTLTDNSGSGDVTSVAFSPSGATLAVGNTSADLWNVAAKHLDTSYSALNTSGADSVSFSPDGKTLAVADGNDTTYLLDVNSKNQTATFTDPKNKYLSAVAYCPTGSAVAVSNGNGHAYVWNIYSKKLFANLTDPNSQGVISVAYSPDGATLATGDLNGETYLWTVESQTLIATFNDGGNSANGVAFSRDGTMLAVADGSGNAYLWNVTTKKWVNTLSDPGATGASSVAFSPHGTGLAVADSNGKVYLWNLKTNKLVATLTDPGAKGATSVAFSPDGKWLAVGDNSGNTYLWRAS
jgi:serine/threonine protein kinase